MCLFIHTFTIYDIKFSVKASITNLHPFHSDGIQIALSARGRLQVKPVLHGKNVDTLVCECFYGFRRQISLVAL